MQNKFRKKIFYFMYGILTENMLDKEKKLSVQFLKDMLYYLTFFRSISPPIPVSLSSSKNEARLRVRSASASYSSMSGRDWIRA